MPFVSPDDQSYHKSACFALNMPRTSWNIQRHLQFCIADVTFILGCRTFDYYFINRGNEVIWHKTINKTMLVECARYKG